MTHQAGFPHQQQQLPSLPLQFLALPRKAICKKQQASSKVSLAGIFLRAGMRLCCHHRGSLLHHPLPAHASLHIIHNRRLSNQPPQTTTEQEEQENSVGFEVESQRRFLSKLANDLSIHDVPSLSLFSPFSPLIFLYFSFIHPSTILLIVFFLLHTHLTSGKQR